MSACFRQWRAHSHCRFLHGYALEIRLEFAAEILDELSWVVDFGALKGFRSWLENTFDHKTPVAEDDPQLELFQEMDREGIIQIVIVPATSCEAFAFMVSEVADIWLKDNGYNPRVRLAKVEVKEHGGNSAIFLGV
jgi:6-pyruvoyltetrahydropterin/6-carboxytetrahydropterin synthase